MEGIITDTVTIDVKPAESGSDLGMMVAIISSVAGVGAGTAAGIFIIKRRRKNEDPFVVDEETS